MDRLWQDLRFSLRTLARRPGFTLVAVLTLALGVGAVSSVVTVVNAVLLQELPYPEADRLVLVTGVNRAQQAAATWPISYLDFVDWRRQLAEESSTFTALAAHTNPRSFNLAGESESERVSGEMVSAAYFRLLGVEPVMGRLFTASEDSLPADERVALLSYELFRRRFGTDARLAGQTLTLNDESYQVVGVLPPGFAGLTDEAQIWVPVVLSSKILGPQYTDVRPFRWLTLLGRLAPGVSVEQAQAALDAASAALEEAHPETNTGIGARLTPLAEAWFGDLRPALVNLLAAAAFVLLIACANVANLLLARAAGRQREVAVRQAVGAGRGRLLRQLLTESAVLALAAAVVGLALARGAVALLKRASAFELRSFIDFQLDPSVLGVTLAVALASVVVFGLVPAWLGSRADLGEVLKEGGKGSAGGRHRLANLLVVAEVWLAVFLLAAAGLAIRAFVELRGRDVGFRAEGVLTLRSDLQGPRWADPDAKRQLQRQLLERLQGLPAVGEVALAGPVIPTDEWLGSHITIEEWTGLGAQDLVAVNVHSISPDYFATLGVPLLEGRDFTVDDTHQAQPVAIVSRTLARRYWPGERAVGKRLKFGPREGPSPWFTVEGVVGDVRHQGVAGDETANPDVYFSIFHIPPFTPPILNVLARPAAGPAAALGPVVRDELRQVAPTLPVYDVRTLEQRLDEQVAQDRFVLFLMGTFAALALIIAAVGIYGVLSYAVAQRGHEIAIRMALGAHRRQVTARVLKSGTLLAVAGLALGAATALVTTPLLARYLPGSTEVDWAGTDALSLAGASAVLLLAALLASYLPARRAARVSPMVTLRGE